MIHRILSVVFIAFLLPILAFAQEISAQHFSNHQVDGSITLYDYKSNQWLYSDSLDSKLETIPASTFKIINLLIALETGVIKDQFEVIKWVGTTDTSVYGYRPNIYRDMTVKEAFELSAGWVFIELSKRIGRSNYQDYLKRCEYGNAEVSEEPDFWNFGPLLISPREQIEFLVKVYKGQLPFSQRNIDILKSVMTKTITEDYILRGKTGWGWYHRVDSGWWVGYIEKADNVHFFATRLQKKREDKNKNFQSARITITDEVLKELGIL